MHLTLKHDLAKKIKTWEPGCPTTSDMEEPEHLPASLPAETAEPGHLPTRGGSAMTASRRDFLKILSTLPLAAVLDRPAAASPPAAAPPARLLLNRFSIAGFQYYDGPALAHRLRPGEELIYSLEFENGHVQEHRYKGIKGIKPHRFKPGAQLKLTREPRNPHDPFAVEIHLGKIKLGYVPRSDNKHISRLLDQGAKLECRVVEVDAEVGVWNMVKVEVWMI